MKYLFALLMFGTIMVSQLTADEIDVSMFDRAFIKKLWKEANFSKVLVISDKCFDSNYGDAELVDIAIGRVNQYFQRLGIPYVSYNSTKDFMQGYGGYQNHIDIASKASTTYYVIVKLRKTEMGQKTPGAYYSNVNITLDCFDTENGLGVASVSARSEQVGSRVSQEDANFQAAQVGASKASEEMITQMVENISDVVNDGTYYEIKLFNVRDYIQAKEFKDVLTSLPEFTGEVRMSNVNDYYRFEISYKNKRPDVIADKIFQESIKRAILRTLDMKGDPGKLINFILK